ncbi:MAG: hypothetical protein EAY68_05385 [Bacteroidetes bacterium]|nr:MAG: hypothetical protein EAY68_05385 [Bacteroidota bacterium]
MAVPVTIKSVSLTFKNLTVYVCLSCWFVAGFYAKAFCQERVLSGVVKEAKTAVPISQASVVLLNKTGLAVAFDLTASDGSFSIRFLPASGNDSLWLQVRSVNFLTRKLLVSKNINSYEIQLDAESRILDSVKVKTVIPIKVSNDTLSYSVQAFSRAEDRSIADVLKRLPGITVADNGQISYNGKAISNLFIQGDDLMDGRYGLATKAVKKELINRVEVIQNHQPISVLRDKVFSADVAINLSLKDNNSTQISGEVTVGAGLPSLYVGGVNAIMLNKKAKFLNSIMANNTGTDYRNDFKQYAEQDIRAKLDKAEQPSLLSTAQIEVPDVPQQHYYKNNSATVNLNNLVNRKDSLQIRTNIQFLTDRNSYDFSNNLVNFTSTDTFLFSQLQQQTNREHLWNIGVSLQRNKHNQYFQNTFNGVVANVRQASSLQFNSDSFPLQLQSQMRNFSNSFTFIPKVRKNILTVKWVASGAITPQQLLVNNAIDIALINNGVPFGAAKQNTQVRTLFSNATVSYRILNKHLIQQQYEIGTVFENQLFTSSLLVKQLNGNENIYTGSNGNNLNWLRNRFFTNAIYSIQKNRWSVQLSLPLSYQRIHFSDTGFALQQTNNQPFLNPQLVSQIPITKEDYISITARHNNQFGGFQQVFRGTILSNYRTLQSNISNVQEQLGSSVSVQYNFRRALQMLFITVGAMYGTTSSNTLQTVVLNNNSQQTQLLPFQNVQNNWLLNTQLSKYFFSLKTRINLQASWQQNQNNQLINNTLAFFANRQWLLGTDVDAAITPKLSTTLGINSFIATSSLKNGGSAGINIPTSVFSRLDIRATTTYKISKYHLLATFHYINSKQENSNPINIRFLDVGIRRTFKKIDVQLQAINILNTTTYQSFWVNANTIASNNFSLRGRFFTATCRFNF